MWGLEVGNADWDERSRSGNGFMVVIVSSYGM